MEIFGAGGTQGPQPIYPRLAAFSVDAGQTVHAGAPRDHVEISPLGQMLDGIGRCPRSVTRRSRRSAVRSPPGRTRRRRSSSWPSTGCSTS